MSTPEEIFVAARSAIGRDAKTVFDNKPKSDQSKAFKDTSFLLDATLRTFCRDALAQAKGRFALATDPFPAIIWKNGRQHTTNGKTFKHSLAHFVGLLETRAQFLADKGAGWVLEPTTNSDGQRINDSTLALHALFLDCDGNGSPDVLLTELDALGFAYVAYQSGGWSPTTPKWRVVFPLAEPFYTTTAAKQTAWKSFYKQARVVFGALGQLSHVGFDAATDTPCCPWFLTERRELEGSPRRVVFKLGHTLDAMGLAMALPAVDDVAIHHGEHARSADVTLSDTRLEAIVAALATATADIKANRRDLYMSLPGVLLDRGLSADDVLTVVESVSERYPRHHPDKHADNVHCAQTTIAKWEHGGAVTRIGELNRLLPEVAAVVDAVVPNEADVKIRASLIAMIDANNAPPQAQTNNANILHEQPVNTKLVRKEIVSLRRNKINKAKKTTDLALRVKLNIDALLLDRFLEKQSLAPTSGDDALTGLGRNAALKRVAGLLAFKLPRTTPRGAVKELFRGSVNGMLNENETADTLLALAEAHYLIALNKRIAIIDARNAQMRALAEQGR